jgi:hypothetical protein
MKALSILRACLLIAAGSTLVSSGAATSAEPPKDDSGFSAKFGYDRTSGRYGQSGDTVVSMSSLTVTYDASDYSFDVAAPYIQQRGPGRLIAIAGRRPTVIAGPDQKASGQGDITAGATRYLLTEEVHGVDLDLGAIVKIAAASSSKGLGSGKNDLALQSVVARSAGPFNVALTLGYTFIGKPPGQGFTNAYYGSVDGSYRFNDAASVGVTYSDGGAVVSGLPASRDFTYYVNFKPSKGTSVELYALSGRSAQSPDRGLGITVALDF